MKKIITLLLALVLPLCAPIYALAATPDESDFFVPVRPGALCGHRLPNASGGQ